jgi:hypothetical protein
MLFMLQILRPTKIWFFMPLIFLVLGLPTSVFLGLKAYNVANQPKTYITLPGGEYITIQKEGVTAIYYEYTMAYLLNEDIVFYFKNIETGDVIESYLGNMSASYQIGGINGKLVAQVKFPQAGEYFVTSSYTKAEPILKFLVGKNVLLISIFLTVFAIIIGASSLFAGFGSLAIILTMRSSARKKMNQSIISDN